MGLEADRGEFSRQSKPSGQGDIPRGFVLASAADLRDLGVRFPVNGAGYSLLEHLTQEDKAAELLRCDLPMDLRRALAWVLSGEVLTTGARELLWAAVDKSLEWEAYPRSLTEERRALFTPAEEISGRLAAVALQSSIHLDEEREYGALSWLTSANSVYAAARNDRAALLLARAPAEHQAVKIVTSLLNHIDDRAWRRAVLPILIGIDSADAAIVLAAMLLDVTKQEPLDETLPPERRNLSGHSVQNDELDDRAQRAIRVARQYIRNLEKVLALTYLSIYTPQYEDLKLALEMYKFVFEERESPGRILLPFESEKYRRIDKLISHALAVALHPRFSRGEERQAKDALADCLLHGITEGAEGRIICP